MEKASTGPTARAPRLHYGYIILAVGLLSLTGTVGMARFSYTMILPAMRDALHLQNTDMGLIGTFGFLGYLAMAMPGGALAARFGARRVITASLFVCAVGLGLMSLVDGLAWSIVLMVLIGVGSSPGSVAAFGFSSAWFVGRRRATANGVVLGGPGMGILVVGLLVPVILLRYGGSGWRWAWFYSAVVTFGIGIVCWILLRDHPGEVGLQAVGAPAQAPQAGQGTAADSAAGRPALAWGSVYRSPEIWRLCATTFIHGFVYIILGTFFAAYAQDEVGLSKAYAGSLWSIVGLLSIFSGLVGGLLCDRLGRAWAFSALFLAQLLAHLLVAASHSSLALYASIFLYGVTVMGFPAIVGSVCGDILGARLAPAGVGFVIFFFSIGQSLGPIFAGALYDASGSFVAPFLVAVGLDAVGIVVNLVRRRR